jgi:hypothetical protein
MLLAPDAVDRWIAEQQRKEGSLSSPSLWLAGVAIQPEERKQWKDEIGDDGRPTGRVIIRELRIPWPEYGRIEPDAPDERPNWSHRMLSYSTPEHPRLEQPVRAGGQLDTLRRLSLALAKDYVWEPEQATMFVLTGLVPYFTVVVSAEHRLRIRGRQARDMSVKHLELAIFTKWHEGETLAARMAEWNARFPEWAYHQVTNFGRDSLQAGRRLQERMHAYTDRE